MKAKDYAKKLEGKSGDELKHEMSEILMAITKEVVTITEARGAMNDSALKSVIKEQRAKWQAFCRIVNKDLTHTLAAKEKGFIRLLVMMSPRVKELFEGDAIIKDLILDKDEKEVEKLADI